MSRLISYYEDFDKPVPAPEGGPTERVACDLAVVGGGGAGLAAAVRAAELGASVLLFEKMDVLGGNTRLAGGLLCTNSKILAAAGVPDTTEAHIDAYRREQQYRLDPGIYERFIRNTGELYDWLAAYGLDTENRRVVLDKVIMIRDRTEWEPLRNPAYGPGLMGSAVTGTLIRAVEKSQTIRVQLRTQVTSLKTRAGAVVGLRAVGGGHEWDVTAGHVVLASGGFGCNAEMLKTYFPAYFASDNYFTHYCLSHCTGDGLVMAGRIGAELGKNMSIGLEAMNHMPGAYTIQRVIGRPEGLLVSSTGRRFLPEDDMENGEFAMDMQPDGVAWYLFNQSCRDKLYQLAVENSRYGDWMPEIEVFHRDLEDELPQGKTVRAETAESLAAAIGAPAQALEETIRRYAGFCEAGHDADFCKDPQYLLPMGTEGPWYAVKLYRKFDVTMGGVSVDSRIRALRPDGTPIPGLYVCGDVASNWMGPDYGPLFSSFSWAVNSGYIAAGEACGAYQAPQSGDM